jgi:RNA polymerase sigma factor (TIGR02999 family)
VTPAELFPEVYAELRRLAGAKLRHETDGHTLDATALVHEVWLKLGGGTFATKSGFFRAAAQAMRRILIDHARARTAAKRGGGAAGSNTPVELLPARLPDDRMLELSEALDRLAATHPQHAELVSLRFFAGLTADEAAEALGVSPATGDRMWAYARARLTVALGAGANPAGG